MKESNKADSKKTDQDVLEEKNKYESAIVTMIDGVDDKIKQLKAEGDKLKDSAKETMDEQIVFLAHKRVELQKSLSEIKENSDDKWEEVKRSTEENIEKIEREAKEAFEGLKSGINYLFSKFKKD